MKLNLKKAKKLEKNLKIVLFLSLGGILLFITIVIGYNIYISQEKLAKELLLIEDTRIGNTLQEYYNNIRSGIGIKPGGWWEFLLGEKETVKFATKLAAHDIGLIYWPEYEKAYYQKTNSYSYIDARRKIDMLIYYLDIDKRYKTDIEKLRKILTFINGFVRFEHDFNEILRAPLETLSLKSGDCDDFSILVAALLKHIGINSAVAFVKSKDGSEGHAMVLFQSSEWLPFYYYDDLTQLGLDRGRWYFIEPQKRFDEQNERAWFNKWVITSAASVSQK